MERLTRKITNIETGGVLAYTLNSRRDELKAYRKLGELEDLAEQGRLLILPCKVGDIVWLLFADGCIEEHTVSSIRIGNTVDNICFENDSYYTVWGKDYKSLNKWLFTTREEAEAALEKMKGENK